MNDEIQVAEDAEEVDEAPGGAWAGAAGAALPQRSAVHVYSDLLDEKNRLETELTRVAAELKRQEGPALEWFEQAGVDSIKIDGGRSLFLRRELWAVRLDGVSPNDVAEAVIAAGMPDLAKRSVNMTTLSALVREWDREGQPIPATLSGVIRASELFKIGTRRASTRGGGDGE